MGNNQQGMNRQGALPEKAHFDVAHFANNVAAGIEMLNAQFQLVGRILHEMKAATEKNIKKEVRQVTPGDTQSFNFHVMSIYVDNSNGSSAVTLIDENSVTYTVAANSTGWVHPLGSRYFDVQGQNAFRAVFVDEFIPIK